MRTGPFIRRPSFPRRLTKYVGSRDRLCIRIVQRSSLVARSARAVLRVPRAPQLPLPRSGFRRKGGEGCWLYPVIVLFFYESSSPRNCFSALTPFISCGAAAAEGLGEDRGGGGARVRCRIKRRRPGKGGGGSFNPRGEIFRRSWKPGFWIRRRSRIRRQRALSARQQTARARALLVFGRFVF